MFLRIDALPVELPASTKIDPESASAVQELMGGRFGEMSTFNNYFAQSMNLRGKKQLGPYYELVANIAARASCGPTGARPSPIFSAAAWAESASTPLQ